MNDLNSYIWLQKIFDNINFDNLPHGIIINGPRGIGKRILANAISSQLLLNKKTLTLDKELFNSNNHPDYFVLNKEKILLRHITYRKAKKRDEWDEELGERNVNEFLSTTPSVAINKVVLILNAHTMDKEPQNALLKSLEEPSPNSFIIITSDRQKALYQTIYSRCQVITIPSLTNSEIDEWLVSKGISDFKATDFPSYASPLNIINDIKSNEHNEFKDFINILNNFFANKLNQTSLIKNLNNLNIDLITKLNYLIEFLKIILKSKITSEQLSGIYKIFNNAEFNNLKISNLIEEINNLRIDFYKVPQINETHIMNYLLSELKNSIKI